MKHARDAFVSADRIATQWRDLAYGAAPDLDAACRESDALGALLERLGVTVEWMPADDDGMDSIYVRDASIVCDRGAIACRMGKPARRREPDALARAYRALGLTVLGAIESPGTVEGGDTVWLGARTLAVGHGYRTNHAGIDQLAGFLGDAVELIDVPLPHWQGPTDVFHLMSMISPLADDLALVYSPLLPVPFRQSLIERGIELVEVPAGEFESMACNVLAVAPRVAIALEGNPETRRRLRAAGVDVHTYRGDEISIRGCGGPTCLTRPLERSPADAERVGLAI